ncbi:MAG TPA: hypothetical protein VL728_15735 [Cyclobacteriaceae bacterium]|nr:hypothetical protein [Cyclobacteriaceae bacterium]
MKRLLLILLVGIQSTAFSQDADLKSTVSQLQKKMSSVASGSKTFEQKLESPSPGVIKYMYDEVDSKGVKTPYACEFNLSDIDTYAIRQETQKDLIFVTLTVKNKQKLAKFYKNNEPTGYDETVRIHAKDVDNARAIADILKAGIAPAEKYMAGKFKLTNYNDMLTWLTANLKNVTLGTKSITQSIAKGDFVGSVKYHIVESDGKSASDETYTFNLADLNPNTISYKISGNRFALVVEASQNLKSISYFKDGQNKPFVDDIEIATNNVDEARDIKTVLSLAIPKAIDLVKNDMPKLNTDKDALQALTGVIKEVKVGGKTITQAAEAKCITVITRTEQTSNATEKNTYTFNWMDINPNTYKIEVSGDKMFIDAMSLDKKKLIMNFKNEKLDGYDPEVRIFADNIEVARRMKFIMDKVIDKCKATYKEPFATNNAAGMVKWLNSTVGEVVVEGVSDKQTFEQVEASDPNKIKFTSTQVKSNASVEEVYEFNLSDVNPMTVDFDVKGKWVYVGFESNFKNKIIKYYKGGKIQPYVYQLDIAVADIETARNVISALKKSIDLLKTK